MCNIKGGKGGKGNRTSRGGGAGGCDRGRDCTKPITTCRLCRNLTDIQSWVQNTGTRFARGTGGEGRGSWG